MSRRDGLFASSVLQKHYVTTKPWARGQIFRRFPITALDQTNPKGQFQLAHAWQVRTIVLDCASSLIGLYHDFVHSPAQLVDLIGSDAAAPVQETSDAQMVAGGQPPAQLLQKQQILLQMQRAGIKIDLHTDH